jgi:hypothetical protein
MAQNFLACDRDQELLLPPSLLLSGYVTQRLARTEPLWRSVARGTSFRKQAAEIAVVVRFGFFPASAEVTALSVTMAGGQASDFEAWLVSLAVAFGTWTLAFALVWPWFRSRGTRVARCACSR